MRRDEFLHDKAALAVCHPERLPAVGVENGVGRIHRPISRGIGIAAQLVGAVRVAEVEDRFRHDVPDATGLRDICR
jgi:hypothetical protein